MHFKQLANEPVLFSDDAAKLRLRSALELDGLHPFETIELASGTQNRM